MLDLRLIKTTTVIGGGTAGWFAALSLRKMFPAHVEVKLIESPAIGIVGVGEGGLINLISTLNRLNIPVGEFMRETGAALKWGFCYEGWRTGQADDQFYHLFVNPQLAPFNLDVQQFLPLVAGLIAAEKPLYQAIKNFDAIQNKFSQQQALACLEDQPGISSSLHFDSQRVTAYLSALAVKRGVIHVQAKVEDISFDQQRRATQIITDQGNIATDFIMDASGFGRVVLAKHLDATWDSFKEYLILDRAIPFHLLHQDKNPELVTRATAMQAGWMWQIPLVERIGAGYVFSSEFCTEQQAIDEIEQYFGFEIEAQRTLKFEPGYFKRVWQGNVMAIGLASGFVEPLEATSIGQMLEQLRMFEQLIHAGGAVVSAQSIADFNQANAASWQGVRDFLRMHYDCPRRDTPFWQQVAKTPYPESYQAIKQVFRSRTPRMLDIQGYAQHQWHGMFHVVNWIFVAQALGLLNPAECLAEINLLPTELQQQVLDYVNQQNNQPSMTKSKMEKKVKT